MAFAPPSPDPPPDPRAPRLLYLDGLRGLAALYAVLVHALQDFYAGSHGRAVSPLVRKALLLTGFGKYAVVVFIVLSGYCLMLPVVHGAAVPLGDFLRRRARRILPPYYAALILCLIAIALIPALGQPTGTRWDQTLPAFTPGVLLSHAFLVHNWNGHWDDRIDYPMWSIAVETQIYFFFPLLLLPLWRRFGVGAAVVAGFAVGLPLAALGWRVGANNSLWFLGLFALGMAAAALGFTQRPAESRLRARFPWLVCAGVITLVMVCLAVAAPRYARYGPLTGTLFGTASACLLVGLTMRVQSQNVARPVLLRVLESAPISGLGRFSYSLYLVHAPLVALGFFLLSRSSLPTLTALVIQLVVVVPLTVTAAYGFFLAFEKPFLRARKATTVTASTSPVAVRPAAAE